MFTMLRIKKILLYIKPSICVFFWSFKNFGGVGGGGVKEKIFKKIFFHFLLNMFPNFDVLDMV